MAKRKVRLDRILILVLISSLTLIGLWAGYQWFFAPHDPAPLMRYQTTAEPISEVRYYEKLDNLTIDGFYPKLTKTANNQLAEYLESLIQIEKTTVTQPTYFLVDYKLTTSGQNHSVIFYSAKGPELAELTYQFERIFNFNAQGELLELAALFTGDYLRALAGQAQQVFWTDAKQLPPLKYYASLTADSANFTNYYLKDNQLYLRFLGSALGLANDDWVEAPIDLATLAYYLKEDYPSQTPILKTNEDLFPIRYLDLSKPLVAFTFDDGPHRTVTPQVLANLTQYQARATFFVLGLNLDRNREIIQQMDKAGHQIGNHSYNHRDFTKLSVAEIEKQLGDTNQLLIDIIDKPAEIVRLPFGNNSSVIRNTVGTPIIYWSIDTNDWQKSRQNDELLAEYILKEVRDGSIVLMHDVYQTTADTIKLVLPELIKRDYQLVTIAELAHFRELSQYQAGQVLFNGYPKKK